MARIIHRTAMHAGPVAHRSSPLEAFFVATRRRSGLNRCMQTVSSALIRNSFQPQLLALEAERSPFMQFGTWLADIARKRGESSLCESELRSLKEAAAGLNLLAMSLHGECLELGGQIDAPALDEEPSAVHLYQQAAFSLATCYMWCSNVLSKVAEVTSGGPADAWDFRYETIEIDRWAEQARIYRILGNQQYRLDRLEAQVG